jgi:hypothetical protein
LGVEGGHTKPGAELWFTGGGGGCCGGLVRGSVGCCCCCPGEVGGAASSWKSYRRIGSSRMSQPLMYTQFLRWLEPRGYLEQKKMWGQIQEVRIKNCAMEPSSPRKPPASHYHQIQAVTSPRQQPSPSKAIQMAAMPRCDMHQCDCLEFISEQIRTVAALLDNLKPELQREIASAMELQKTQMMADWVRRTRTTRGLHFD